jgi:DNA-binding transcriptional regulator LsrR (DeoR family)
LHLKQNIAIFKIAGEVLNQMVTTMRMDEEAALAARAAWLHFAGGKTQGEVAEILGVQSTKAHRLIARARSEGLIRVFVEGPIAGCIALEEDLKQRFGLTQCEVLPNIDEGALPLRTLATAGARYLVNLIQSGRHKLIGIGHGRTLAASVDAMPTVPAGVTKFVSLLGGLTRRFAASPFDVIHRLAERTSAESYVMPVPFFANTVKDKRVLESQFGVSDTVEMARNADIYIAGIGEVDRKSFIATGGMVDEEDIDSVINSGACAEILGQFFDADGKHMPSPVSDRAMAPRLADLRAHRIVALAGGTSKTQAIRSILESGLLFGLITDEATAKRLVSSKPAQNTGGKSGKTT